MYIMLIIVIDSRLIRLTIVIIIIVISITVII